jgi:hypothetical protein
MGGVCGSLLATYKAEDCRTLTPKLKTGDIVLFSSKNAIIRGFTGTVYTHVGIVVVSNEFSKNRIDQTYMLQSDKHFSSFLSFTRDKPYLKDHLTGTRRAGVSLVRFSEAVRESHDSGGTVYVRRLLNPPADGRYNLSKKFLMSYANKDYEEDPAEFVQSALDIPSSTLFENEPNMNTVFCSELAYDVLCRMNLICHANRVSPNETIPADFSSTGSPHVCGTSKVSLRGEWTSEIMILHAYSG